MRLRSSRRTPRASSPARASTSTAAPPARFERPLIVEIPPRFRVAVGEAAESDARTIVLNESRAFGDGTHETTAMCVQALAAFAPKSGFRMLDVGSGTGILSIAAAKLGGTPVGVEIDESANEVARENAKRNQLEIPFATTWPEGEFDVVVANILREILIALAPALLAQRAKNGLLVLSGLVSTDVPAIVARYAPALDNRRPEIFERNP